MTANETIAQLEAQLLRADIDVPQKYRALFSLRNVGCETSARALEKCLLLPGNDDSSALLKHEIAYALGQMGWASSLDTLTAVLSDASAHSMVRHEAGEAIGALALPESASVLKRFVNDPVREVAETCVLALDRIEWLERTATQQTGLSKHLSVDPAPPVADTADVAALTAALMNTDESLFERYRAMFALRDLGSPDAVQALCDAFCDESALLKHEVAFVLGQMAHPEAIATLSRVLSDRSEHIMVRHEAAEALGACAGEALAAALASGGKSDTDKDGTLALLQQHLHDDEAVVAQSVMVALDVADHAASNDFEYCEIPK